MCTFKKKGWHAYFLYHSASLSARVRVHTHTHTHTHEKSVTVSDLLSRLIDAPLAEGIVAAHAVDRGFVRTELHVVHLSTVGLPLTQTLLLEHVWCVSTIHPRHRGKEEDM